MSFFMLMALWTTCVLSILFWPALSVYNLPPLRVLFYWEFIMVKRMLIDDTQPEETRVVVVDGNKIEDVEFESTNRKQIKGNIYLAKVMRIEPSLQAAFVDYGGNRHGFLAFGEIHPDYYNVSDEIIAEVDKEVDDIIEAKKQYLKDKEAERERIRAEKARRREERLKAEAEAAAAAAQAEENAAGEEVAASEEVSMSVESVVPEMENQVSLEVQTPIEVEEVSFENETISAEAADNHVNAKEIASNDTASENTEIAESEDASTEAIATTENSDGENKSKHPHHGKKRFRRRKFSAPKEELKVLSKDAADGDESVSGEADHEDNDEVVTNQIDTAPCNDSPKDERVNKSIADSTDASAEVADDDDDDDDMEVDFELQRKLLKVRKLYHRSTIQDVIKEGQILLVQVVKEERGNKGAALTTYISLAGRYCVLMPNRIKSGGVSRKITNATDRKRLKDIVKELPLTMDMSMIVRTAGEEKSKADIVRDYNYLIRTWNNIRVAALKSKAPILIHEEGNLIKRALRDMFTRDMAEVIVDGDNAYRTARDFIKMLAPQNMRKIKSNRKNDLPLFQRFQVESQLDKLHDTNVQLESGGYLVINPTEALVSIDVNSGRATKEKDLEETALKTNLEAADEIARQLRMRDLAGLIVVDFIDMEDPKNNLAIEKRMKEAMKDDRSRVQIAKMSCFGLLEISRQRMHSSFFESNYKVCPFCHGKGLVRTIESSCTLILRAIEEEGIKSRATGLNVFVPADVAIYILNQKRDALIALEKRYNLNIFISADNAMKCVEDFRIERIKTPKQSAKDERPAAETVKGFDDIYSEAQDATQEETDTNEINEVSEAAEADTAPQAEENEAFRKGRGKRDRRNRFDRRDRRRNRGRRSFNDEASENGASEANESSEPVILYNSHESSSVEAGEDADGKDEGKKSTWWRKLIS